MDDLELKTIVQSEIEDAAGYIGGELTDQRSDAMDYYLGEPFGNEQPDRSDVVSTDVSDCIEWILPFLMKTFTGMDDAIVFDPVGEEDEKAAEQQTDYVNHVFFKDNPGWLILYSWFKDALLQKNGIVKVAWEDNEEVKKESYEGLTEAEVLLLTQHPNVEIKATGESEEPGLMDVQLEIKTNKGRIKVVPVPPEEFGISRSHNSVIAKDAPFVFHKTSPTITELLEMGFDVKVLEDLPSAGTIDTEEEISRKHLDDEQMDENDSKDPSMRRVEVYECYLLVDFDGDGRAELRKVTMGGNEILSNEEIDQIPFVAITPTILTHKFFGLSVADAVMSLQKIKSTVWRQMLDNIYLSNNRRTYLDDERVNMDDYLTSAPGQPIRTVGNPSESVMPDPIQDVSDIGYKMLAYTDTVKEGRVGVGANTMGANDSILSNPKGDISVERVMGAAEQRIELIARVFAETGIKQLWLMIHKLVLEHQEEVRSVKMRGEWVKVDPREWEERDNMTVQAGLGRAEKNQQLATISQVMNIQEKIINGGGHGTLVTEQNIYTAASDFVRHSSGFVSNKYFTEPDSPEAQQFRQMKSQQPDPMQEMMKVQAQAEQQKAQNGALTAQIKKLQIDNDALQKKQQVDLDYAKHTDNLTFDYEELAAGQNEKLTELELEYNQDVPGSSI